jgi:4-amino-4-deoxy-L-arabinose transferase-like glycosyltransferase
MLPPLRMPDSPVNTSARKRRYAISGIGLLCGIGVFLLMSHEGQLPHATVYGSVLLVGFVFGLFSMLNLLEPPHGAVELRDTSWCPLPGEPRWAAPQTTVWAALIAISGIVLLFSGHALPYGVCVALAILFVSALRRPGLMVFVVASAMYLPLLGRYGLWDPWETHYGEVSREILSRDDWISLWWAQDRWFWSKPILIFWVEALIWSASGLNFRPDTNPLHTEWVLRIPIYLMSITALLAVYATLARIWNKRAGLLAALALASMPYYAFLTHQAITDLPFVANMTTAMMLLVLGMTEDPEKRVKSFKVGPWALSAQHAVIAMMVLITLPQLLYLASRNVTLISSGFAWHRDVFMFGSAGNPDVPGNFGVHDEAPRYNGIFVQPLAQALYWGVGLATIIWALRKEQRGQQLYMFAFYAFCALAFMAKGIPGFALPGFVAMVFLLASGKFKLLFDGKLRVAAGMAVVLVLGMPWFVAMYVRHGQPFTDRLLVHDHLNRLTTGVHGDNGSIQYFIWQLGYGIFPWVGLAPLALGTWLVSPARANVDTLGRSRRDLMYAMGLWFAVAFTLFSAMTTKFHHYIFPAVPPIAVLIGLLLDRLLPRSVGDVAPKTSLPTAAALLAPVPLVLGAAGWRGNVRGILPANLEAAARDSWVFQHGWPAGACIGLLLAGIAMFVYGVLGLRQAQAAVNTDGQAPAELTGLQNAAIAVGAIAGTLVLAFVARDLSWHVGQPPGSERLIHLFVYNYNRPFPEHLDYRAPLFGFGLITGLFTLLIGLRKLRAAATLSLIGAALAFTVFILDVYMVDLSPHWSQRELVAKYYAERKGPEEPLLAYQMNWKGENYYTGNRVHVFVDLDNKKLLEWVEKNKGKTVFIVLEHSRLERLKRILPGRDLKSLTTVRDCNKFVLVKTKL